MMPIVSDLKMSSMSIYKAKRILITGHTGFKGAWLCEILRLLGAEVTGYSLEPPTSPSLFELAEIGNDIVSVIGDVRDLEKLKKVFDEHRPEIVFHLAAQPLVRESYRNPVLTYETNVMGTVNVLECVRNCGSVKSFLNVTTDKVYLNDERKIGFVEDDKLCGLDPYSNSKSCSELVTFSYKNSFFANGRCAVSTARAGNVIGGGDFAKDRIIPDCVRAAQKNEDITVRNPYSTRPYQHVLEPLFAYLMIAAKQYEDGIFAGNYNVGPDDEGCFETGKLVDLFVEKWGGLRWINKSQNDFREANFLKLDNSKIKNVFGWRPTWNLETAMEKIVEWSKLYISGAPAKELRSCMDKQIGEFLDEQMD